MTTYDETFYETIRAGCQSSAAVVVPLVHKLLKPQTVVDVGCGEGWWAKRFAALGCEVHGVDGPWDGAGSVLGVERFTALDLGTQRCLLGQKYDLVVCLEVAEHLPPERAEEFISDLCRYATAGVLFSAAIPGQGGVGHVNCRWPSYWAELFERYGWRATGGLRRELWTDQRVEPWYRQNLLLAVPADTELKGALYNLFAKPWPLDLVHPEIWRWYR